MKLRYWIFITVVVSFVMGVLVAGDKEAMKLCEKTHSYDTCFNTLNN